MVIRVRLFGVYSTGIVAPSLALKLYFGATVMIASGTLTTVAGVANDGWSAEGLFIVQTIGAIGTVEAQGLSEFSTASTAVLFVNMDNTAPLTLNTTIAQTVQVSVQWGGTVNASDTITLREMTVEVMSAAGIASPPPSPPFSVFFAEDGEEGMLGPQGLRGPSGIAGVQGLSGPSIFMVSDDGQDGDMGPPGVAGAPGSGVVVTAVPGTIKDLVYWWSASDILTSAGNVVTRLREWTPYVSGVMASNSASGVTVNASALNGLPILKWPAATVAGSFSMLIPTALAGAATFFVVINPASAAAPGGQAIVGATGSGGISFYLNSASGGTAFNLTKTAVASIGTATTSWSIGTAIQANATYNATTGAFAFRQSRAAAGSGTGATGAGNSSTTAFIGCDDGTNLALLNTASLAEVIVYNRVLTGTEISNVENYLNTKWGV
jgi:hypothetical protein